MTRFNRSEVVEAAEEMGVRWDEELFDIDALWYGMNTEVEHSARDPETGAAHNPLSAARIALANLREFPDHYDDLRELENESRRGT